MDSLDYNLLLDRKKIYDEIKDILNDFEKNKSDLTKKRGIYIYGAPGTGKTQFIMSLLKDLNYDVIKYDAGDIRNKCIMDNITKHTMSDKNILSLFYKNVKPIAILMDEIDGMNNGDKGGINSLIKLIRPKKTKKQKNEKRKYNPIICISNYHVDKKIKELMKVCVTYELKTPTNKQITDILYKTMPELDNTLKNNIIIFLQGDLKKLESIYKIYKNHCSILKNEIIQNILKPKSYNEDTKEITKKLLQNNYNINEHLTIMNETDRTIVGLLWHENIIDIIQKFLKKNQYFYKSVLDNICYADYIDRITFKSKYGNLMK